MADQGSLNQTPLTPLHKELGARMVPFAGYEMPVQYPEGIMAEHRHTRSRAGLFDISHMGHLRVTPGGETPDRALERVVPGDVAGLEAGRMRYTMLLNERGGIEDDLMVARPRDGDELILVVNAATKDADEAFLHRHIGDRVGIERIGQQAFLALQGPEAAAVMTELAPSAGRMAFMDAAYIDVDGATAFVSRSGYTGEDGFEITLPADHGERVFRALLDRGAVAPVGLGARDTLRLEAGLCLYGHDLDTETTPVEAALSWTIGRRRREEGGFLGADVVLDQLANGPPRKRVGLVPDGRAPVREGAEIQDTDGARTLGTVTSGGFGPTVNQPVAMGYVTRDHGAWGTRVNAVAKGRARTCTVARPRFVKNGHPEIVTQKRTNGQGKGRGNPR